MNTRIVITLLALFLVGSKGMAQCPTGHTEAELTIYTVNFSTEIYWALTDTGGNIINSVPAGTYITNNTTYGPNFIPNHKQCLNDTLAYDFCTYDSFGDSWNGNTYEWNKGCNGQLLINNNGLSPNNGLGGFIPNDNESCEVLGISACTPFDLAVTDTEDPVEACQGNYFVDITVTNWGIDSADNFELKVIIGSDTADTLIGDTLAPLMDMIISMGPFNLAGSPSGTTYNVDGWLSWTPDTDPSNDSLTGLSVDIYSNTPWTQSPVYAPVIVPNSAGTLEVSIPFCDPTITNVDSCFRVASITIDSLNSTLPNLNKLILRSPAGTELILSDSISGVSPHINGITFTDTASTSVTTLTAGYQPGEYMPKEAPGLAKFYGEDPNGNWTLVVVETNSNLIPLVQLKQWTLTFEAGTPPDLGPDVYLCSGEMDTLDAGSGYASLIWMNGSSSQQEVVFGNSIYYGTWTVFVEDHFGCDMQDSVDVLPKDTIVQGTVMTSTNQPMANTTVYLISHDLSNNSISATDTVTTDANGFYQAAVPYAPVWVKVAPAIGTYPNEMPTYYGDELLFVNADSLTGTANCDTLTADITAIGGTNPGGVGFIGGLLSQGANKTTGPGDPLPNFPVFLMNGQLEPVTYIYSDGNGAFGIDNLAEGDYTFWVDSPRIENNLAPTLTLEQGLLNFPNVNLVVHSFYLEMGLPLGVESSLITDQTILVYPNPANDVLTIDWTESETEWTTVRLINNLGQETLSEPVNGQGRIQLSLEQQPAGMYHLQLSGPTGTWHGPVVVSH